jgi:hypothetical protein
MGKRFIISESEKEDIKSKHEIDIDQKLFTYLRRNLKFKKRKYPGFDWEPNIITYVYDNEEKVLNSKKDALNWIFANLPEKYTEEDSKTRRTIRKYMNDSIDSLK